MRRQACRGGHGVPKQLTMTKIFNYQRIQDE